MEPEKFEFTVDTHLFRELGELLVGRDSTALVELIKNAYDADATTVKVRGENLLGGGGTLTVTDNGIGMTPSIFRTAFLRVASRYKEQGKRTSPLYKRRYTGAKGVGRLSAHKLAERLYIESAPNESAIAESQAELQGVEAVIDWRALEDEHSTIDDVGDGLKVAAVDTSDQQPGTELRLEGMRARWTKRTLSRFVREISGCLPPDQLLAPPPFPVPEDHNPLGQLNPWTRGDKDPGFEIIFEEDLDIGEDLWLQLFERSNWLLEIKATSDRVTFGIHPAPSTRRTSPGAQSYLLHREHPSPDRGPFFTARIYVREGQLGDRAGDLARFAEDHSGIRVYLEGFRVVPYGERHDDWLGLNQDYARRVRELDIILDDVSSAALPQQDKESFKISGNFQYVGGVFMTAEEAEPLRPVVNREGFLQDDAFGDLRDLVRNGVDLLTRARAAARMSGRSSKAGQLHDRLATTGAEAPTEPQKQSPAPPVEAADAFHERDIEDHEKNARENLSFSLTRVRQELTTLRASVGSDPTLAERVEIATAAVDLAEHSADQEHADQAMLEVLASVGLQFAAFIHEVNGLLSEAQAVRTLAGALDGRSLASGQGQILQDLRAGIDSLCQALTRQASYLTEVVGPDARRRRRRIPLNEAPSTSLLLLDGSINERGIQVTQLLDSSVKTPPMFPAELTIICTNLLTNAVKAAGRNGRIMIAGGAAANGGIKLRVENTGVGVALDEAERWFRPFETTTTEIDVVLGQGMGLGLPITRRMVSEYAGTVRFVEPSPSFATAVEVFVPGREGQR
ncbi:ATP-binding protein [Actinacidiphila oryziradicis]|uniref:ATP-binding protein n=1 Tax=Actinacidiphila oryziradicis TaxID=2571141 RepID=UPI00145C62B5|nr:ATP-binding protein [Actinacidiphila oryziradicis]